MQNDLDELRTKWMPNNPEYINSFQKLIEYYIYNDGHYFHAVTLSVNNYIRENYLCDIDYWGPWKSLPKVKALNNIRALQSQQVMLKLIQLCYCRWLNRNL